eukprot:CAMPEP_0182889156 /NCGR_PEP_ID=MMETSP0034_2-20130328/21876_1 /TAXON_ID=156128 /ORGANISM="Nephroselmis pyriformis, Strain CCMP717" /LENGTH=102 /DNA_ID=CAMNT_0025022631 /DNA_START=66 /DNA_END=373 /DNA_ORIENTATION=-
MTYRGVPPLERAADREAAGGRVAAPPEVAPPLSRDNRALSCAGRGGDHPGPVPAGELPLAAAGQADLARVLAPLPPRPRLADVCHRHGMLLRCRAEREPPPA